MTRMCSRYRIAADVDALWLGGFDPERAKLQFDLGRKLFLREQKAQHYCAQIGILEVTTLLSPSASFT